MKKIIISTVTATMLTLGLAGCTPGYNTPGATAIGAAAGGLLGGAVFGGSGGAVPGIIGGALLGGGLGYVIGRHMDRQDQANMQSAIINTPVNEQAEWTNQNSHVTYQVRPTRNYHSSGRYCREYQTRVKIGERWKTAYGRACRMPDGSWKIVK